ncbi:MAG: class I SAM-dependent RNA methyltransferase, partial [Acidobacteria bacterium]|nr:class I SAM-dependent RNA methyltransferase [Acidobacteriota bacterium]
GCDLQHLEDARQTRLKAEALKETLERLGGLRELPPIRVRAGSPWGYRLRTQLHSEVVEDRVAVGYRARGSHQLVAVDRCPVLVPELEAWLPRLPLRLGSKAPRRLDLCAGDGEAVTMAPVLEGLPHGEVLTEVEGFSLAYDARCFFQGHRGLLGAMVQEVVGAWEGEVAYDLYGGVGLFGLPLAKRYRRVVTVEGDRLASRFARNNARRNRLTNVEVVACSMEGWVERLEEGADRVVVDPPRTGLSPKVRSALLKALPRRLSYVSCHPAALARDLRALTARYRLESLTALELFPQTGHLEAVVQLVRSE